MGRFKINYFVLFFRFYKILGIEYFNSIWEVGVGGIFFQGGCKKFIVDSFYGGGEQFEILLSQFIPVLINLRQMF